MSTWSWQLSAAVVDQGTRLDGSLTADTAAISLAGVRLRLRFPSYAFQNLSLTPLGFSAPGDELEQLPDGEVLATRTTAVAGAQDLLGFSCDVVGRRGASYQIEAELLEAYDTDGIPIAIPKAVAVVAVAPGALGIVPGQVLDETAEGEPYGALLLAEGGTPPYSWSLTGGALPAGLTLSPAGTLDGMPAAHGSFHFTATVADSAGATAAGGFDLVVRRAPPRIAFSELPPAHMGRHYDFALALHGGEGSVSWQSEGLPQGLSVTGGRLQGWVTPQRAAVGVHSVRLVATDGRQRATETTLPLLVLPFTEWPIPADAPGVVAVGRDLYVTDFKVSVRARASTVALDSEGQDTVDQAKEDIMGDIAELLFELGESGDPADYEAARGLLTALMGEYRQLDEWSSGETAISVAAKVWIDGVLVKEMRPEPPVTRGRGVRAHPLDVMRARRRWRSQPKADYWPAKRRSEALRWGFHYLGAAAATRDRMRKEFPRWAHALDGMISVATAWRIEIGRRLSDAFLSHQPADEIRLTPGPHRVKVEVDPWIVILDPGLAPPIASASAIATIEPVNREVWQRLRTAGEVQLIAQGDGTTSTETIVDCGGSALDVVYASGSKLWIVAATGNQNQPYAPPKAFSAAFDFEPTLLAAGRQDDIGRRGLIAASRHAAVAITNRGPGGHDSVSLVASGEWEAIGWSPVRSDGWARVLLLERDSIWIGAGLDGGLTWRTNTLAPPLVGDSAVRMAAFTDDAGRTVVGLAYFLSGLTRFHLLAGDGTLGSPVSGPAWGEPDYRRQIAALRSGAMEPGGVDLVQAQRQGRHVSWSRMTSGGWSGATSFALPLPVRALAPGPGGAGGALVVLEPDDAVALVWSAHGTVSLLPVDLPAGVREVDGSELVAAVTSRDADLVRVLVAPEVFYDPPQPGAGGGG